MDNLTETREMCSDEDICRQECEFLEFHPDTSCQNLTWLNYSLERAKSWVVNNKRSKGGVIESVQGMNEQMFFHTYSNNILVLQLQLLCQWWKRACKSTINLFLLLI